MPAHPKKKKEFVAALTKNISQGIKNTYETVKKMNAIREKWSQKKTFLMAKKLMEQHTTINQECK